MAINSIIDKMPPPKKVKTIGEEGPTCNICCLPFNKSTRKEISCKYCPDKACMECIKHYLLDTNSEYHCMFCRNKWSRDILAEKLPQKFLNEDLRSSLENRIVDMEKARLPMAQEIAEERIRKSNYRTFIEAANTIKNQYSDSDAQKELIALLAKNYGVDNTKDIDDIGESEHKDREKPNYIRQCPNSECRGFVNSDWNCGLCSTKMCKRCYERIDEDERHVCNPDILETNKLLNKDSKPCPKCQSLIFRISGCSQMFCVLCHTAFSWDKGTIEKGPIHNPHYFQWLQTQNKETVVNNHTGCNEDIFPTIHSVLGVKNAKADKYCEIWVSRLYQYFVHIYHINRPPHHQTLQTDDKMEADVNYLLTKIGKTEWKKQLYQIDRNQQISRDVVELIEMAYGIAGERFRAFISDGNVQHIKDLEVLSKYVVEQTDLIRKRYSTKNVLISNPEWYN
jgi:hypothetical protein